jgi:hypothetical protein
MAAAEARNCILAWMLPESDNWRFGKSAACRLVMAAGVRRGSAGVEGGREGDGGIRDGVYGGEGAGSKEGGTMIRGAE